VQRLRELGWVDGRNLAIEYRWAEGRPERVSEIAAEFVRIRVDVIVTVATPATLAAKQATAVIPIVGAPLLDPVGTGLVASLARPGSNVTGLANQVSDTVGKKLEFLREVVPDLRRLAIVANVGNPASVLEMGEAQATARTLGLEVTTSEIRRAEDIAPAFEALKDRTDALYIGPDPLAQRGQRPSMSAISGPRGIGNILGAIPRSTRTGPACQNTASRNNACCSALVRSTSKRGRPTVRAGASGSLRGKRGNAQFRAPKSGLRMISRSVAPEFDVIDRGMAALLD
jgi:ABC transporter substrate binding protein